MPSHDDPTLEGWPIVEVSYPPHVSIPQLKSMMDEVDLLLERREPFAVIHRTTSSLDAAARQFLSDRIRVHAEARARYLLAEAVVTTSPLVRGVLTAIHWLFPYPNPVRVFDDLDAARAWCASRLGKPVQASEAE